MCKKLNKKMYKIKNLLDSCYTFETMEDYAYSTINGLLKVIMMKSNRYVNATKLCNDYNKKYSDWRAKSSARMLIKTLNENLKSQTDKSTIKVVDGSNDIIGTYVHPSLIIHIAIWCDVNYALKISEMIIDNSVNVDIEENNNNLSSIKNEKMVYSLTTNVELLRDQCENIFEKVEYMYNKVVNKNREDIVTKYPDISFDKKFEEQQVIIIIKNNDICENLNVRVMSLYNDNVFEYTIRIATKKSYKKTVSDHKKLHPNMKIIFQLHCSYNAEKIWDVIKAELWSKIKHSGYNFNLRNKYFEINFLNDITEIYDFFS